VAQPTPNRPPRFLFVNDAALNALESAFNSFFTSEEARLKQDLQFLSDLTDLSELQQVVNSTINDAVVLADQELSNLLGGI